MNLALFKDVCNWSLTGLTYEIVLVFIGCIIVYGRSFEENLKNFAITLGRIEEANLKLSPSKCTLFQSSILFLGHIISKDRIESHPAQIAIVSSYPVPKMVKQVRAFLGITVFNRKCLSNFGKIAQPLYTFTVTMVSNLLQNSIRCLS